MLFPKDSEKIKHPKKNCFSHYSNKKKFRFLDISQSFFFKEDKKNLKKKYISNILNSIL